MMPTLEEQARARGIDPTNLSFTEPWQARAFALAFALADRGAFDWDQFRQRLIEAIAAYRTTADPAADYFNCWIIALEASITASGVAKGEEVDRAADNIADHPAVPNKSAGAGPIKIA